MATPGQDTTYAAPENIHAPDVAAPLVAPETAQDTLGNGFLLEAACQDPAFAAVCDPQALLQQLAAHMAEHCTPEDDAQALDYLIGLSDTRLPEARPEAGCHALPLGRIDVAARPDVRGDVDDVATLDGLEADLAGLDPAMRRADPDGVFWGVARGRLLADQRAEAAGDVVREVVRAETGGADTLAALLDEAAVAVTDVDTLLRLREGKAAVGVGVVAADAFAEGLALVDPNSGRTVVVQGAAAFATWLGVAKSALDVESGRRAVARAGSDDDVDLADAAGLAADVTKGAAEILGLSCRAAATLLELCGSVDDAITATALRTAGAAVAKTLGGMASALQIVKGVVVLCRNDASFEDQVDAVTGIGTGAVGVASAAGLITATTAAPLSASIVAAGLATKGTVALMRSTYVGGINQGMVGSVLYLAPFVDAVLDCAREVEVARSAAVQSEDPDWAAAFRQAAVDAVDRIAQQPMQDILSALRGCNSRIIKGLLMGPIELHGVGRRGLTPDAWMLFCGDLGEAWSEISTNWEGLVAAEARTGQAGW